MQFSTVTPLLAEALSAHGYTALTPVQAAVIEEGEEDLKVPAGTGIAAVAQACNVPAKEIETRNPDQVRPCCRACARLPAPPEPVPGSPSVRFAVGRFCSGLQPGWTRNARSGESP